MFALFDDIGNQWIRAGMDGTPFALDYRVLFARMDRLRLSDKDYEAMFQDIKHMEREALRVMSEQDN